MNVNFYATLRPIVGGKTVDVPWSAPLTARAVLEVVTDTRPELRVEIWHAPGELNEHIKVFINGRQSVHLPQGLNTLVQLDDTLDVFPPVGGG